MGGGKDNHHVDKGYYPLGSCAPPHSAVTAYPYPYAQHGPIYPPPMYSPHSGYPPVGYPTYGHPGANPYAPQHHGYGSGAMLAGGAAAAAAAYGVHHLTHGHHHHGHHLGHFGRFNHHHHGYYGKFKRGKHMRLGGKHGILGWKHHRHGFFGGKYKRWK